MKSYARIAGSLCLAALAAVWLVGAARVYADTGTSTASTTASAGTNATGTLATSTPMVAPGVTDICAPSAADLAQVAAVENNLVEELALRKQLLSQTITCAEEEATTLQTSLNALSVSGDSANLAGQLSSRLDDAINFYNIELTKLNGAGISGSEAIAKEVLAYRTGSYDPIAGDVNNFIIWNANQSLFTTAADRMDQTSRAVSFLEGATPDSALQDSFNAALASFQSAQALNQSAYNALAQFLPPDQSLNLIQQSLASLSDTYQQFFNVSTEIQALLPQ